MTKKKQKIDIFTKKAIIGPLAWNIVPLDEEQSETLYGQCTSPWDKEIRLNSENTGMRALETLLHETIHAFDNMAIINLTEEQVEQLGYCFAMFLRDNEWIFKYTIEKLFEEYPDAEGMLF